MGNESLWLTKFSRLQRFRTLDFLRSHQLSSIHAAPRPACWFSSLLPCHPHSCAVRNPYHSLLPSLCFLSVFLSNTLLFPLPSFLGVAYCLCPDPLPSLARPELRLTCKPRLKHALGSSLLEYSPPVKQMIFTHLFVHSFTHSFTSSFQSSKAFFSFWS